MRKVGFLLITVSLFSYSALCFSQENVEELETKKLRPWDSKVFEQFINYHGTLINKDCYNDLKACGAFKQTIESVVLKPEAFQEGGGRGDPSWLVCTLTGGYGKDYKSIDGKNYGICVFPDNTKMDTWDVYNIQKNRLDGRKQKSKQ